MADRTEFLIFARRLHSSLRQAIEDGDGRTDEQWLKVERPRFEHHACGMYLAGALSYIEDKYGVKPWTRPGSASPDFDSFISNSPREHIQRSGIGVQSLEALVCIRNAVIHNNGDLAKNRDQTSVSKVSALALPGAVMNGTRVQLVSQRGVDFMEHARLSLVLVAQYHGDG